MGVAAGATPSDVADSQVSARLVAPAATYLRERGFDPREAFESVGIPLAALHDASSRLPGVRLRALLLRGAELTGEPEFGLRAGMRLRPGDFGVFEYLVRTSESESEVEGKVDRYYRLIGDLRPHVERGGGRVRCALGPQTLPTPVVEEYNLTLWLVLARAIRGESVRPSEVTFTHEAPAHRRVCEEHFQAPLRFEAPRASIVFEVEADPPGKLPVDTQLRNAVEESADRALAQVVDGTRYSDLVRELLRTRGADPPASLHTVAGALHMSARTLRRRLEREETCFNELRDAVRRETALRHMRESRLPLGEIAFLAGFASPSAFHRAFRRWTGKTPAQFRAEQGEG